MHVAQTDELSGLSQKRRRCLASRRPRLLVPRMLHVTDDLEPPALHTARGVAERLEGNSHLDLKPPVGDTSLRLPEEVGAQIVLTGHHIRSRNESAALALHAVRLYAERVDDEDERTPPVVEGVEMHLDVVVTAHTIAVSEGGVDRLSAPMRLEGADPEVDRGSGIEDEDVGGVGCGTLVDRLVEGEPREKHCAPPCRLIERAIDRDVRLAVVDAWRANLDLIRPSIVHCPRRFRTIRRLRAGRVGLNEQEDSEYGEHSTSLLRPSSGATAAHRAVPSRFPMGR